MHKLSTLSALLAISLLFYSQAFGQEREREEKAPQVSSKELEVDGVNGVWFEMTVARRLLADTLICEKLSSQQRLLEQKLQLTEERAILMQKQAEKNAQIAQQWQLAAQKQQEVLQHSDAWYRSPYIWLAVGVVIGAGGIIGAVSAAN